MLTGALDAFQSLIMNIRDGRRFAYAVDRGAVGRCLEFEKARDSMYWPCVVLISALMRKTFRV